MAKIRYTGSEPWYIDGQVREPQQEFEVSDRALDDLRRRKGSASEVPFEEVT